MALDASGSLHDYFSKLPCFSKLVVRDHPVKKRILCAKQAFAPGDNILIERPLVMYPRNEQQEQDTSTYFPNFPDNLKSYEASVRLLFAILTSPANVPIEPLLYNEGGTTKHAPVNLHVSPMINELAATPHPSSETIATAVYMTLSSTPNGEAILQSARIQSAKDLLRTIDVLQTNQYEMHSVDGSGLFPLSAMLSHECVPNAVFATRSKKILLFAIKPIAKDEEITISYIEDYYPTRLRQNALRTNRGFACCCQYCIERPDRARAFRCPDCNNGVVLPVGEGKIDALWKCQYCGYEAPGELKRQMESDEEALMRLITVSNIIDLYEKGTEGLKTLHPSHYLIHHSMLLALEENIESYGLVKVEELIDLLMKNTKQFFQAEYHPSISSLWALLAQARLASGSLETAATAFESASCVATICTGHDSVDTRNFKQKAALFGALAKQFGAGADDGDDFIDDAMDNVDFVDLT